MSLKRILEFAVIASRGIADIEPNRERCREYVQNSIGLVTALNLVLGRHHCQREMFKTGGCVYGLITSHGTNTMDVIGCLHFAASPRSSEQFPNPARNRQEASSA